MITRCLLLALWSICSCAMPEEAQSDANVMQSDALHEGIVDDAPSSADTGRLAPSGMVALDAASIRTCGLDSSGEVTCWREGYWNEGKVLCWGHDQYGQSSPPPEPTFVAIDAGYLHTCGVQSSGEVLCWGTDKSGQSTPPGGHKFTAVSAGMGHSCALRDDGKAVCWGSNLDLYGNPAGQATAPADETFTAVAAASLYTCGLKSSGAVLCWGLGF